MSILSGRSLMHHRYGDGHYQQIIVHTKTGRMLKLDVLDIDEDETCCGPCNTPTHQYEQGRKEGEMEGTASTPTSSIGSRPLSHHRRQNRPTFFNYHAKHTMMDPAFSPSYVNHRSPTSSSSCCDSPVESVMSCRSYSSPPTTPAYRPTVTVDVPQGDDEPIVIDPPTTVTFSHDPSAEVINISITTPVIPPDYKSPPTLSRPLSCPSHHLSVSAPSSAVPSPRSPSQRYAMRRSSDCMIHSSRAYSSTTVHAALASIKSITPRMPPKKVFSRSAPNSPVAASPSCDSTRSHSSCDVSRTEDDDGEGEEGQVKSCVVEKVDIKTPTQIVDEKSMPQSESTATTTSISISLVTSTTPVAESSTSTSTSTSTCIAEGEIKLKDIQGEKELETKVEEITSTEVKIEDDISTSENKIEDEISTSDSSDDTDSDPEDIKHEYKQEEYKWNDVIPVEISHSSRRITPIISPHPHKPIRLLPHSPRHTSHAPLHLHTHTHTHMSHYNTHPPHHTYSSTLPTHPPHHTYSNHTYPTTLPYTSHVQVHATRPPYVSAVQRQLQHLQPMYSPHHVPPPSSHIHPHIYPSPTASSAAPYHQTVTYSQPSAV